MGPSVIENDRMCSYNEDSKDYSDHDESLEEYVDDEDESCEGWIYDNTTGYWIQKEELPDDSSSSVIEIPVVKNYDHEAIDENETYNETEATETEVVDTESISTENGLFSQNIANVMEERKE